MGVIYFLLEMYLYTINSAVKCSVRLKYLSFPNSNFPGPFLRKLPLIHVGIVPVIVVGMGSGVSSTERTKGAIVSSPLAFGHRCQLGTERGDDWLPSKKQKTN